MDKKHLTSLHKLYIFTCLNWHNFLLKLKAVLTVSIKAYISKNEKKKKRTPSLFIPWADELENQRADGVKGVSVISYPDCKLAQQQGSTGTGISVKSTN